MEFHLPVNRWTELQKMFLNQPFLTVLREFKVFFNFRIYLVNIEYINLKV